MRRLVLKTYDCVVFVSSVIFFFYYYVVRVCLFSLEGRGGGRGEGWFCLGAVGCKERECGNRRRVSVRVTGGRV